jgi:hypothetical protein
MRRRRVQPIAPFHEDPNQAAAAAFDRNSDQPVGVEQLCTYLEVLAQYHLHPEAKFLHGSYLDSGHVQRRHIHVTGVICIGKEANRWEEQFFLGADQDAAIVYGEVPGDRADLEERVRQGIRRFGQRATARAARMSLRDVSLAAREPGKLSLAQLKRLDRVLAMIASKVDPTP